MYRIRRIARGSLASPAKNGHDLDGSLSLILGISPRQIIDVSGDGRETTMREFRITPRLARNMAAGRGITVDGLAILDDEPDLDTYYRHEVIGGPGAFVEIAGTIDDFARAMRVKLLREIEHRPVVGQLTAPPAS